ncbi:hypothetical protein [Microbacterium foliorum]|uniref:hypothetical protein n=1 Tax=Microbacterium foliorum TaxID=104336 RepID=UPI001E197B47|nr:hypothetical protein [Microbacterium foliorum]CAH0231159.1 hypothetical protein SRABI44_02668 [Microbacterium foliorum]CAH0237004.1 hypothetical protein SRABI03_02865 [Microbacterium foliorum]
MVDHDDPVEETVMLTRRAHRSRRSAAAPIDPPAVEGAGGGPDADAADDAVDDRTIAVPRADAADDAVDDRTIAVPRERAQAVEDQAVVVARRRSAGDGPAPATGPEDLEDHTVVVDRTADAAAPTREPVEDAEDAEDHTVAVGRALRPPASDPVTHHVGHDADAEDLDATIPAAPARRVEMEPLPAIYKPRPAPLRPSRPPKVEGGVAPTRVVDDEAASVSRAARRTSIRVLAALAAACVVSVCGLVALALVVFT